MTALNSYQRIPTNTTSPDSIWVYLLDAEAVIHSHMFLNSISTGSINKFKEEKELFK